MPRTARTLRADTPPARRPPRRAAPAAAWLFAALALALLATLAAEPAALAAPPDCDVCGLRIESLDRPADLRGTWLFTREDRPENADPGLDASDWVALQTPGPWRKAYPGGGNFRVGWYRAELEFAPELIGTEVVLLADAYLGRLRAHVDGAVVFERGGADNLQRYYGAQPIPIRFKVSAERHTVALRVDTLLMTGIYQLPLQLRAYRPDDAGLALTHFLGGEVRLVAGFVALAFGLFFLLIYLKVRYPMYLVAGLAGVSVFPFFFGPSDALLKVFAPEGLLLLHYAGITTAFFHYLFAQFFNAFHRRLNWFLGATHLGMGAVIALMAHLEFNLDHFQELRVAFFVETMALSLATLYHQVRGAIARRPGALPLTVGGALFVAAGLNDFLLALGAIQSVGMIYAGVLALTACTMGMASNIFANTYRENKRLMREMREANANLEGKVARRTNDLRIAFKESQEKEKRLAAKNQVIERQNQVFRVLLETSASIEQVKELGDIFAKTLGKLHELFPDWDFGILLNGDRPSNIESAVFLGISKEAQALIIEHNAKLLDPEVQESLTRQIATTDEFVRNIQYRAETFHLTVLPMVDDQQRVIGKLVIEGPFLEKESIEVIQLFLTQVTAVSENKILTKRLERLANTDPLTGIYNRGYYERELAANIEIAKAHDNVNFSVLMVDVDRLKYVNDHYGHDAGDALIKTVAELLVTASRGTDVVTRLGGDEFTVLCPSTDSAAAGVLLRRLRDLLDGATLDLRNPETGAAEKFQVRMSIGLAGSDEAPPDRVVKEADLRMYDEKERHHREFPRT